ncbi:non-ribosomal peptide synthetase [Planktothrix sp. FACHB-1365]|uniref:non-ribosomal peptide synthetase n=1 Tax=Planktothrix sp. FACHB-1365 TaxID=2692855 RepID=UPI001686A475|nr:non-ribosomal peptide synthetase [Planktothrix sp. FACHB-1365]MBD2483967.1 amino acid adenylation domain-containing protein [Planktothrix sp. FACHB-1365]
MNTIEFVNHLRKLNIKLFLEGDRLRCKAPEGILTPALKSEISDRKAEIISFLQQANLQTNTTAIAPISRAENNTFPLSFTQEGLWFLYELQPNSPFYNIPLNLHFSGQLNIATLESSLQLLIDRHEILRANFIIIDGKPAQVINKSKDFSLPVVDLRSLSASKRDLEYHKLNSIAASYVFNLTEEPLLWVKLVQLTPTENVLLLTIHHIIFDGWSVNIFLQELTTIYSALAERSQPNLPQINLQYVDFAVWQQQWLQGEVLESQLAYWLQKLALMPELLELPTARPRPAVQSFRGKTQVFTIEPDISEALVNLSQQQGVTLFMLLLTAFKVLLYRYTNQPDIVVGSTVANRQNPQLQGILGFFVNTLVLRTDLSDNPTFLELLQQVKKVVLEAYDRQELPFDKLVEALRPERNLSYSPLLQIDFSLEHEATSAINIKDLTITTSNPETNHTAKFDLSLSLQKTERGLTGGFEYSTDLFDATTIARMIEHWQTLLAGIVANPEQKLSDLPILTTIEKHRLLVEWNQNQQDYPKNLCIHQLFEAQVEQTPDAVAVIFKDEQLTYRELNTKANQLAHHLQALGVKPETLVGICVERSFEMIVGLLGILKAGGAYVPIDPAYPSERIAYMLDDSQLSVLLTQQKLVALLPEHQARVVCLDSDWEEISNLCEFAPQSDVTPENLAYVIYTSGSTGKPKGVTIQHQSLVNYIHAVSIEYEIKKGDRILQFASISFDASAEEIYPCLTSGATLVLRTDSMLDSASVFLKKCSTWNLTILSLPTAYWHELTTRLSQENLVFPPSLRLVIIGGEKALLERLKTWQECVGQQVRLVNTYGPTEATVVATIYDLSKTDPTLTHLPIGRPICNVQTYILDRYLQPVPVGVPGELHIGGVGLARGYLNRPDLTNEKFIPNPFSNDPNSRLYKTGDLARYLPDGNIEFLGRVDNQVKIRGFRIELGEIEAALAQHPAIGETAVIANENITGNQQLVAYFVPKAEVKPSINDLRHFLKHQLPDYMIPSVFVTLEHLPLTPNGKIDHRALPVPEIRPELELTFVAPRTPLEEILANLWAEVLGLKQIGIYDNFFSLGGHSLLATQIVSKISTNLGIEIPLRHLFEFPTIAELAEEIEVLLGSEQSAQRIPILPIQRTTEIPLSFAQARLWFLDQLQPESAFYNIPHIFRLHGQLNIKILENSLNEIIRRHEALRTNFTTNDGNPVQIIRPYLHLELLILNVLDLSDEARESEAQRLVNQFANQPFNLQNEPLIRSYLLQLGEQDYIFLLVLHHIVADGWSMEILERELSTIYTALCNHQAPALPELPIQYADFSVWQRDWLAGEIFQRQLNYWQQQLQGIPSLLELPTDRPRPAIQTYRGAHQSFQLSTELSEAIISLSKRMSVTPFMLLLAAFQTLLYRYTGQDDIVVGTPIANRHYRDIEGLIGFFVNTLALRANNLSLNPSFEDLLSQVREVTLGAYAHQDMPFEELVEALQPERSLSYSPIFQVMFGVENESIFNFSLPELKVSPITAETRSAKFDLDLSIQNTPKGWIGIWEYNTDLFDGTTIARMTEHFQTLLAGIVTNPKTLISELPLLTATQQHQLLVKWNYTQKDYPFEKCIHRLFQEQVKLTPDAVAVVIEGEQLTYRELNARANQLAHYLQTFGVKAEVLVGICIERSLEMVVGLLGILKAGGAYVPIDPAYPSERKAFILEDTSVPVVLTQFRFVESLPQHQARVVCLDCDWEEISQYSEENPINKVTPDNLVYVIYTSGSTGQPKGVLIEHQALVNHSVSIAKHYDLQVTDRVLQFASISFDVAAEELFPTWISGGTVVLRPGSTPPTIAEFQELINREKLTVLNLPASYWQEWVSVLENSEIQLPSSLRLVVVGNEKVLPDKLINWQKIVGNRIRWINAYGLTETTITSTIYEPDIWKEKNSADIKTVPIGRPISNTQIYVLDAHLQPVPIGVPGELHIGGAGLARGYLNRPNLTAEKFISNPFSSNSKARLYKTGDKVRYLPDGNIEYLGRLDNQVKIRGFRIELGEIETVLNSHPAVQEAVVIQREDIPEQKRLVAYLVAKQRNKDSGNLSVQNIRAFISSYLPDYMIPSAFVTIPALPLTPNGKVDRRQLPVPTENPSGMIELKSAPSSPTEILVSQIWAELLGLKQVGVNNNFFELGGNSLLVIRLLSQLHQVCGVDIPIHRLFEFPTVAGIAQLIDKIRLVGTIDNLAENILDLSAEAVLEEEIRPQSLTFNEVSEPKCIFLTDAIGFVGSYLLYELLQQTTADIYCLVNASNSDEAKNRLQTQLEFYSLWQSSFSSRILPVIGNLSQPLLGITTAEFENLANQIDVIYHSGECNNVIYPYAALKAVNVTATQEVLRLASQIKIKPVHFISTLGVFYSPHYFQRQLIAESDPLDCSQGLTSGYGQSKWVAEKLMMMARERGLPVCIYRLGRFAGHSQTGAVATDDWLFRMIKGCIQLGMFPESEMMIEMIPIDYASKAIVCISQAKSSLEKAFHITNHHQISWEYLTNWIQKFGYPVRQVSFEKWHEELISHLNYFPENALHSLLTIFSKESDSQKIEFKFDNQNTLKALSGTEICCPPLNAELLNIYFSYFLKIGFLSTPEPTTLV